MITSAISHDRELKNAVFALDASEKLVHVSEVPRGKACRCHCVACGTPVIAKQGIHTAWHFAHESTADCQYAAETALHKAVKQVILEGGQIALPDLVVEADARVGHHVGHAKRRIKAQTVAYATPRLEVRIDDIVADAVVVVSDQDLIVEVAVTHLVGDEKLKKLQHMCIPAIELEAWKLNRTTVDWSSLRLFVAEDIRARKWLFNPRTDFLMADAKAEAYAWAHAQFDKCAQAEARAASLSTASAAARFSATTSQNTLRHVATSPLSGNWQVKAQNKFMRLWAEYQSGRILTITPSIKAANMILRWDPSDAPDDDEKAHFDSLLNVVARSAHIEYRDENGHVCTFQASA